MTWRPAHRLGALLLGLLLVLAGLAAAPPPVGAAALPAGGDLTEPATLADPAEAGDVLGYWTRDRMEAALPLGIGPADDPVAAAPPGSRSTARATARARLTTPRSVGKLFFTTPQGDAVCSAAAVNTPQRNVIITAAHCAHSGPGSCGLLGCTPATYFSNFLFVPRYANGAAPDGRWVGARAVTHAQWIAREDVGHDQALIEVLPRGGRNLVDVVGGNGIAWNYPARQSDVTVWGWSAEAPYDGETVQACWGQTGSFDGTADAGIACPMTGGSSGGPWFLGMVDQHVGFIWAVTSRRTLGGGPGALIARPLNNSIRTLFAVVGASRPMAAGRASARGATVRAGRVRLRAVRRHVGRGQVIGLRVRAPRGARVVVDVRRSKRGKWRRTAVARDRRARVTTFTFRATKAGRHWYRVRAVRRTTRAVKVRVHACPLPLVRNSAVIRAVRCSSPSR